MMISHDFTFWNGHVAVGNRDSCLFVAWTNLQDDTKSQLFEGFLNMFQPTGKPSSFFIGNIYRGLLPAPNKYDLEKYKWP